MIKDYIAILIVSVAVLVVSGIGYYLVGSPVETRGVKYDQIRLQDFTTISTAIQTYYSDGKKLPGSLNVLLAKDKYGTPYLKKELKDPKTGAPYNFVNSGSGKYQLCATFDTSSTDIAKRQTGVSPADYLTGLYGSTQDSSHPKGYFCMDKTLPNYQLDQYYQNSPNNSDLNDLQFGASQSAAPSF